MSKYPNLIIAGAPKSGTSSLFFWLGAHPAICASHKKETYFMGDVVNRHNSDLSYQEHGLSAYQEHFSHCKGEKIRLEATPVYLYYSTPLQLLPRLPEMPKIIFILRKPADRLYSHWKFNRYRMKNTRLSFEDYLDESRIPPGWSNYIEQTHYVNYILPWVEVAGKENVLVYQFEHLKENQRTFMQRVARDLSIDASFYEDFDFFHRNETVAVKHKTLHRWGLKLEPLIPHWLQEKLIPIYLKMNANKVPPITEEEKRMKKALSSRFEKSNRELQELFPGLDLQLWRD